MEQVFRSSYRARTTPKFQLRHSESPTDFNFVAGLEVRWRGNDDLIAGIESGDDLHAFTIHLADGDDAIGADVPLNDQQGTDGPLMQIRAYWKGCARHING